MRNLKRLRGECGLSQLQLAEKIGCTRALIVLLEKEESRSTSEKTTQKLCEVLNTTPCLLYGIDNLKYQPQSKKEIDYLIEELKEERKKWDC